MTYKVLILASRREDTLFMAHLLQHVHGFITLPRQSSVGTVSLSQEHLHSHNHFPQYICILAYSRDTLCCLPRQVPVQQQPCDMQGCNSPSGCCGTGRANHHPPAPRHALSSSTALLLTTYHALKFTSDTVKI